MLICLTQNVFCSAKPVVIYDTQIQLHQGVGDINKFLSQYESFYFMTTIYITI